MQDEYTEEIDDDGRETKDCSVKEWRRKMMRNVQDRS